eukprot:TRINITY_DN56206_c0_g1_i2.p1 TRINITY_DN56206_c0_g1~~TRINITY_DN56206_c0_g1_i2.p1  ORF type:complete len:193 (-),score=20.64 TRINITY_DN56206_c0_g1_i2:429-1007(-)
MSTGELNACEVRLNIQSGLCFWMRAQRTTEEVHWDVGGGLRIRSFQSWNTSQKFGSSGLPGLFCMRTTPVTFTRSKFHEILITIASSKNNSPPGQSKQSSVRGALQGSKCVWSGGGVIATIFSQHHLSPSSLSRLFALSRRRIVFGRGYGDQYFMELAPCECDRRCSHAKKPWQSRAAKLLTRIPRLKGTNS